MEEESTFVQLTEEIDRLNAKLKATEDGFNLQQLKLIMLNNENENLIKRFEIIKTRPVKTEKIRDWAMQHFGAQMIIHERAERLMTEVRNEDVDLSLLCDSLEFLANEYWELLNGIIDIDDCQRLCSVFYNRPFEIGECGELNIQAYPEDYIVTYNNLDVELTHYMSVCNNHQHQVSIYFHYDETDQTILVGSMPGHLRTVSK